MSTTTCFHEIARIAGLTPAEAAALERSAAGLPVEAIAVELGLTENAVRVRLSTARRRLLRHAALREQEKELCASLPGAGAPPSSAPPLRPAPTADPALPAWIREEAQQLLGSSPILRADRLAGRGIHTAQVDRLCAEGLLTPVGPGLYRGGGPVDGTLHRYSVAVAAVPCGVIALRSALWVHGLEPEEPAEVWLLVPRGARLPPSLPGPVRTVSAGAPAFESGIEERDLSGAHVRLTSVAKSLVDCIRYRKLVGAENARGATERALHTSRCTREELLSLAARCRVLHPVQAQLRSLRLD